jgi:hypothetical protein
MNVFVIHGRRPAQQIFWTFVRFVALKLHGYAILSAMNQSVETTSSRQTFPPDPVGMQESFSGFSGHPVLCLMHGARPPRTAKQDGPGAVQQTPAVSIPMVASSASGSRVSASAPNRLSAHFGIRIEPAQVTFPDPSCIA